MTSEIDEINVHESRNVYKILIVILLRSNSGTHRPMQGIALVEQEREVRQLRYIHLCHEV